MSAATERQWSPGDRLPDGRWTPGTLVKTPRGERARVLPYATERPNQCHCDAVFVQPLGAREQPWQLWSSNDLTALDE